MIKIKKRSRIFGSRFRSDDRFNLTRAKKRQNNSKRKGDVSSPLFYRAFLSRTTLFAHNSDVPRGSVSGSVSSLRSGSGETGEAMSVVRYSFIFDISSFVREEPSFKDNVLPSKETFSSRFLRCFRTITYRLLPCRLSARRSCRRNAPQIHGRERRLLPFCLSTVSSESRALVFRFRSQARP